MKPVNHRWLGKLDSLIQTTDALEDRVPVNANNIMQEFKPQNR